MHADWWTNADPLSSSCPLSACTWDIIGDGGSRCVPEGSKAVDKLLGCVKVQDCFGLNKQGTAVSQGCTINLKSHLAFSLSPHLRCTHITVSQTLARMTLALVLLSINSTLRPHGNPQPHAYQGDPIPTFLSSRTCPLPAPPTFATSELGQALVTASPYYMSSDTNLAALRSEGGESFTAKTRSVTIIAVCAR